ncbi:non-ribosomal peptide synthetase, partial [Paenibacillus sp. O199]|uniref:non-ribosomal peptide synthetase n=1 Tax=Paenibacillus sp. O199 TaxID=1643925 RepID=UPI000A99576C
KPEALKADEVTILSILASEGAREEVASQPETVGQVVEEVTGVDGSVHADDIAYLMYTSGTTGEPKGAMVEHRSINRLVKETNYADFINARILQTGSLSFDASTFEIWGALLNGGTLFLIEEDVLTDPAELREVLTQNRINLMFITTALFNQLIRLDAGIFNGVTQLLFGGEATSEEHVDLLLARDHGVRLTNVYGPTENTTFSTYYPIDRKARASKTPIGKPISNTYAYIMNESGLCGIGMPGELYVGGAGVSRGYLNQTERTATSFIANPYRPGEQMYRTGDLARWRSDGNIEYLGRMDQQVKLRGFRIELGEIESRLLEQAGIAEATVQLRKDADDYLCAYVVGEGELDGERIRENLRSILPSYMVPSYVVQLEALPLTRNGKLDRKALPKPELEGSVMYEAPCDEIEQCIADIFSEILGVSPVGVQDDFFERGGHSLRAARLVNRLETQAGLHLSVRDVFAYPTVRLLANRAKEMKGSRSFVPIPAQKVLPYYETSSPQKRLYVIDRMQPGTITYNMPEFIQLKGKLNVEKLQQALQALVDRHEPLRTSFEIQNGEPVQIVKNKVHFELEYEKGTHEHMASAMKTFIRPFDLTVAPLMRAKVWQMEEDDAIFMMDFHHMIYDGGSVPVLMRDLQYLFEGRTLPELRVQYKDYSCWQNERDLSEQEQYWASELSGDIPVLELFTDEPRPKEQRFDGSSIPFQLSKETKEAVRKLSHSTGATDYMILLSGFMLLLSQCSGQEDIIVGSPISGRVHADTENMLGMFVNTLAIRGELSASKTFSELVHQIKEKCLKAYENQEYPFERVVDQFAGLRDLSRNPVFDVMFTLQNNEFSTLALGDLILKPVEYPYEIAKFDLTVSMRETEQGYDLHWEYCTALFHMDTIKRMAVQFEELLKNALRDPNQILGAISIVNPYEKHLILNQFNATDTAYPSDRSVVDLFHSQAALTP